MATNFHFMLISPCFYSSIFFVSSCSLLYTSVSTHTQSNIFLVVQRVLTETILDFRKAFNATVEPYVDVSKNSPYEDTLINCKISLDWKFNQGKDTVSKMCRDATFLNSLGSQHRRIGNRRIAMLIAGTSDLGQNLTSWRMRFYSHVDRTSLPELLLLSLGPKYSYTIPSHHWCAVETRMMEMVLLRFLTSVLGLW